VGQVDTRLERPAETGQQPRAVVTVTPSVARRGALVTAIQVLTVVLLVAILGCCMLVLFAMAAVVNVPGQMAGGVQGSLGAAASEAARGIGQARQALQDSIDPNYPPTGLTYDTQFSALRVWHPGDSLPGGSQYVLTVKSVQRRAGATTPETVVYATLHAELRQSRETRVLGQLIHSDSDPHDYAIYTGELFRIGNVLYRVNWVSQEENAFAAGVLRQPEAVTQSLKFEYD
jgi:hypothetical protein